MTHRSETLHRLQACPEHNAWHHLLGQSLSSQGALDPISGHSRWTRPTSRGRGPHTPTPTARRIPRGCRGPPTWHRGRWHLADLGVVVVLLRATTASDLPDRARLDHAACPPQWPAETSPTSWPSPTSPITPTSWPNRGPQRLTLAPSHRKVWPRCRRKRPAI